MVSIYSCPNIGRRFKCLYLSKGIIVAQGPGIVHTILVAGDSELRAASYIKDPAGEVIVVAMDIDQIRKVIPPLFLT